MEDIKIKENFSVIPYRTIAIYIMFFITFINLSYKNYIIFHIIVEVFGITISFVMFIISINTYKLNKDSRIVFLGIAFGVVGCNDLIHLISYMGMGVGEIFTFNVCIQLWVVGRFLQSTSLLISFILQNKGYNLVKVLFAYLILIAVSLLSIFYLNIFPNCYIDGFGFTSFKFIGGYVNCGILLVGLIYLINKKDKTLNKRDGALVFSIVCNILCELSFLFSIVTDDLLSALGHIFQLLSFYYIYIAFVRSSLQQPYYSLIKLNDILRAKNENLENLVNKLELEQRERKMLEDEREKKKQILNGILESIVDGVEVISDDGKVLHFNNQFENMLNIPFEITSETIDSEIVDFVKTQIKNPEEFEQNVKKGLEMEEQHIHNIYFKDGRILESTLVPFTNNNIIEGKVVVCRDITEKRKIEELQTQIEIRQALIEKAKEFDEIKTNFFCTVSHEFKTPINIILGVIQLVSSMKEVNGVKADKYINIMKQNCYRLIKLSNNLIDITKIDAGYTEMNLKNHNIVSVIEDITLSIAEYTKSKGISLVFDTDIEEKIIGCDAEQLERVMLNLLSNAIKFTEPKGRIEVNIKDREEFIVISVKDSGIGIPEDKVNLVFDRFVQVNSTLTRPKEGSGIGLALVKTIVERHGGRISVKSEIGKGSEFIIEMPAALSVNEEVIDEISADNHTSIDRINIEFSDIYELNVY